MNCVFIQYSDLAFACTAMYEIRQLEVPQSFMQIYSRNGRAFEPRELVESRYEACDDLACSVSEFCMTLAFKDELTEADALQRCHAGLLRTPEVLSASEAIWVVCRVAELLQWDQPNFVEHPSLSA